MNDIKWKPDKSQVVRIGALHLCHDCNKAINTDFVAHLVSRFLFWKRYRCKNCGEHHQRFLKSEDWERWVNK